MANEDAARSIGRGELALRCCENCGFVYNSAFDSSLLRYGEDYDNTQTCSGTFERYVDELIDYLVDTRSVRGCQVVEIGCGKGVFLRKLVERSSYEMTVYGYDPAYVGPNSILNGRVRFIRKFFDD